MPASNIRWPRLDDSTLASTLSAAWLRLSARKDLGYLQLPNIDANWSESFRFAKQMGKLKQLNVLGLGGSGLGGRMLVEALSPRPDEVKFIFDSHPEPLRRSIAEMKKGTGWLVISKSGTTLETLTQLMVVAAAMKSKKMKLGDHIFVITEPSTSPLKEWAVKNEISCLDHPLDVGGRFSVLSPVGLVPAIFSGVNVKGLRTGASRALQTPEVIQSFAAVVRASFSRRENISVFWSYCYKLNSFVPWAQQLWAESLGKSPDVPVSTPLPSYGTCDQHSVLQQYMEGAKDKHVFLFRETSIRKIGPKVNTKSLRGFEFANGKTLGEIYLAESKATEQALKNQQRSVSAIEFERLTPEVLGELIMGFEITIGLLGETLKIDAFNQPGVEAGKIIAKQLLHEGF